MRDPERLLEMGEHALDVELLRAGREDLPPSDLLERTLSRVAAAGVGIAVVGVAASTAATAAGTAASSVSAAGSSIAGGTAATTSLAGGVATFAGGGLGGAGVAGAGVAGAGAVATKAGFFSGMSLLAKLATALVAVSTVTAGSVIATQDPVVLPAARRGADNGSGLAAQRSAQLPQEPASPVPGNAVVDAPEVDATPKVDAPIAAVAPTPSDPSVAQPGVDEVAATRKTPRAKDASAVRSQPAPSLAAGSTRGSAAPVTTAPAATPAAATPAAASPAAGTSDLTEELKMLERARQALLAERPAECIAVLNEYRTRFPKGNLRQEASTLRIKALTANGDASQAEREREKSAP